MHTCTLCNPISYVFRFYGLHVMHKTQSLIYSAFFSRIGCMPVQVDLDPDLYFNIKYMFIQVSYSRKDKSHNLVSNFNYRCGGCSHAFFSLECFLSILEFVFSWCKNFHQFFVFYELFIRFFRIIKQVKLYGNCM